MGKKDLEQLFKEKLGDLREIPDDKVWNSIEASLDKKKQKKRVVPIWWKLGGAAAVLAILLYVINPFGGADSENPNPIVDTENVNTPDQQKGLEREVEESVGNEDSLVDSQEENSNGSEQNAVAGTDEGNSSTVGTNPSLSVDQQAIVESSSQQDGNTEQEQPLNNTENTAVAVVDKNKTAAQEEKPDGKSPVSVESEMAKEAIAENNSTRQAPNSNTLENTHVEEEVIAQNEEQPQEEKQSIFDAIEEQEEEVVAQNSSNKWSVGPSVAPVYFNASGEGSPVHSTFASNSKSGNVDLSYGVTVAYEVGKKLKVRTGIHRVNFGYDTNDVVFTSSLDGSVNLIDNIDYSNASQNIVLESKDKGALSLDKQEVSFAASAVRDGKMIQNLGYLEIPLELNYSLIDKKFGVDLIGGVSSLFLVDNSVLLESEGLVTEVGEANNANSMNFSTNIGLGFNYEFSPKVQLNLEPVFKYQLNTFSDTAGSFRPFSVGVYSGFSFKF